MRAAILLASLAGTCAVTGACVQYPALPSERRPGAWARPLDEPGLENLHIVSPALLRGGQPDAKGFRRLAEMGVRTVVNLRSRDTDGDAIADLPLRYVHLPWSAWTAGEEDIVAFLAVATDPAFTPVFVHCRYGSDRTGLACAAWRVAVQGWSKREAIDEMRRGGFGFHSICTGLAVTIENLDAGKARRIALLTKARETPKKRRAAEPAARD